MPKYNCRTKLKDEEFIDQFKNNTKRDLDDEFLDHVDNIDVKYENADDIKRKAIRFTKVLKEIPNISAIDYLRAVEFCSLYAQGISQEESYRKVFPDRVAKKREGTSTISNSANQYFHGMLVQAIWKQVSIADHILFTDMRYNAYHTLNDIMIDPESSRKEKTEAAKALINSLETPKEAKVRIDIGHTSKAALDLDAKMAEMAQMQLNLLESGSLTNEEIVEAEFFDDSKEDNE